MKSKFDAFAKRLAGGIDRRQLLQWFGGGSLSGMMTSSLPFKFLVGMAAAAPAKASPTQTPSAHPAKICKEFCEHFEDHHRDECLDACMACKGNTNHLCGQAGHLACCASDSICCQGACNTSNCTNILSDNLNCGACGNACVNAQCVGGTCVPNCAAGFTPCNNICTNLSSDVKNCGSCGVVCSFPNAIAMCVNGTCTLGTCVAGYADCNGNVTDGCETPISSDVKNCGVCGNACVSGDTCVNGTCVPPACGSSNPCPTGGNCVAATDCQSRVCISGKCAAPTCSDGVKNGSETDVDCGGSCAPCANGQNCSVNSDCQSGMCSGSVCTTLTCPPNQVKCGALCCPGTACCGNVCQIVHSNGVGQNYFDCTAASTYNLSAAMEACLAASQVHPGSSCSQSLCGSDQAVSLQLAGNTCITWVTTGPTAGHVIDGSLVNPTGCFCPSVFDSSWN